MASFSSRLINGFKAFRSILTNDEEGMKDVVRYVEGNEGFKLDTSLWSEYFIDGSTDRYSFPILVLSINHYNRNENYTLIHAKVVVAALWNSSKNINGGEDLFWSAIKVLAEKKVGTSLCAYASCVWLANNRSKDVKEWDELTSNLDKGDLFEYSEYLRLLMGQQLKEMSKKRNLSHIDWNEMLIHSSRKDLWIKRSVRNTHEEMSVFDKISKKRIQKWISESVAFDKENLKMFKNLSDDEKALLKKEVNSSFVGERPIIDFNLPAAINMMSIVGKRDYTLFERAIEENKWCVAKEAILSGYGPVDEKLPHYVIRAIYKEAGVTSSSNESWQSFQEVLTSKYNFDAPFEVFVNDNKPLVYIVRETMETKRDLSYFMKAISSSAVQSGHFINFFGGVKKKYKTQESFELAYFPLWDTWARGSFGDGSMERVFEAVIKYIEKYSSLHNVPIDLSTAMLSASDDVDFRMNWLAWAVVHCPKIARFVHRDEVLDEMAVALTRKEVGFFVNGKPSDNHEISGKIGNGFEEVSPSFSSIWEHAYISKDKDEAFSVLSEISVAVKELGANHHDDGFIRFLIEKKDIETIMLLKKHVEIKDVKVSFESLKSAFIKPRDDVFVDFILNCNFNLRVVGVLKNEEFGNILAEAILRDDEALVGKLIKAGLTEVDHKSGLSASGFAASIGNRKLSDFISNELNGLFSEDWSSKVLPSRKSEGRF